MYQPQRKPARRKSSRPNMESSRSSHNPDYAPSHTAALPKSSRNAFRAQIAIHRLVLLVALVLLPLLTWHQSTGNVFEGIGVSEEWKERFQELQVPEWKTGLWVAVWILAAVDILHALWCLGWYQELLHPGTGGTRRNEGNKRSDENSSETQNHSSTGPITAKSHWAANLAAIYRRTCRWVTRHNIDKSQAYLCPGRTTPRSYHPLLQPVVIPPVRTILLMLYDAIQITVLALHIYSFLHLIDKRERFCFTDLGGTSQPSATDSASPETDEEDNKRCRWSNASITSAGGVASAIAAILAAMHVAALVCRLYEVCSAWYTALKSKRKSKNKTDPGQDAEPKWHCSPRHVDIQTRHEYAPGRTSRLTQISEEEYDAGGVARRRHHKSRSGESVTSKASSTKLENVLLECLVP